MAAFSGKMHSWIRTENGRGRVAVFITGAVTAVMQTLLIREMFTVVSGNEMIIGIMLAIWLAATAAGSVSTPRFTSENMNGMLMGLLLAFAAGLTGVRGIRLLLQPGESLSPHLLVVSLLVCEAPGAFLGGVVFGYLTLRTRGVSVYRWEQAGSLAGLFGLSMAVMFFVPNYPIAAGILFFCVPLFRGRVWRAVATTVLLLLLLSDQAAASWKYPLKVDTITYAHEGETAVATVDGQKVTFVNGLLYATSYATPAVEQAVHVPLSMLRRPGNVLVINDYGQRKEAMKYEGAKVRCIRTDRLITDTCCPYGVLEDEGGCYDAVLLGCGMPDNAAASRFFTHSFFKRMHQLTGDSGIFSFTLPFQTDFRDQREEVMRSVMLSTLRTVYRYVTVFPGEGYTFVASDLDRPLPDSCPVRTKYFQTMTLPSLTPERIRDANSVPAVNAVHTAAHPRLLLAALDHYLEQFMLRWWMFVILPVAFVALLLPLFRSSMETASVGSSGLVTGIYSVALILLYQSLYGTVYARLSLLLLSLSTGFAAGCLVRRLPVSDLLIGLFTGGTLFLLASLDTPPAPLFYMGNAGAGFLAAAQFVTRKTGKTALLYAADCTGGVLGMALASTILIPLAGMQVVAAGITAVKMLVGGTVLLRGGRGREK